MFLSYTKSDSAHSRWVKQLAEYLRASGIEARIDDWYPCRKRLLVGLHRAYDEPPPVGAPPSFRLAPPL